MLRKSRLALVSLGLALGGAGCNTFLTGDKLSQDPNSSTTYTLLTLFVAMQGAQSAFHEGTIAMMACEWVQQCGATNGRFVEQVGRYDYGAASNIGANGGDWATVYTGGGLIDMRNIKTAAAATGDSVYLGITKIWEALTMGRTADLWSGIPYSQTATSATPDTDSQFAVYAAVQTLLSQAINELTVDANPSHGPLTADLVYGGLSRANQRAAWIAAAWTLKARYWLHLVNAAANGKVSGLTAAQVYDSAIAAATNGISDATGAHDLTMPHFAPQNQQNMWSQFQAYSGFGADLEGGKPLVDYMKARNDPRIPLYFCKSKVGTYGGDSFNAAINPDSVSNYACMPARFAPTASAPYVTYAERELILAEANSTTARGAGGNDAVALTHLQNEENNPGSASGVSLPAVQTLGAVVGPALLDSIMREKWVALFQNIESLMDYRRTCLPAAITFVSGNILGINFVPGRLFYPQSERNVNPTHIPLESQELSSGLRTQSDVTTSCHP